MARDSRPAAHGPLTPTRWLDLLGAVRAARLSGELCADRGDGQVTLVIFGGAPVDATSTFDGDADSRLLATVGGVGGADLAAVAGTADPVESLARRGVLAPAVARRVRTARVARAVGGPLRWPRGGWSFRQLDAMPIEDIDPALLPSGTLMARVAEARDLVVGLSEAYAHVELWTHPLRPGARWTELITELAPTRALVDAVERGLTPGALLAGATHAAGDLARWLWVLDHVGALAGPAAPPPGALEGLLAAAGDGDAPRWQAPAPRAHVVARPPPPPPPPEPAERAVAARGRPRPTPAAARPAVEHVERMLLADQHRLGQNHYRLLGISHDEKDARIHEAAARLEARWTLAAEDERLDNVLCDLARRLLGAAQTARADLGDPMRRAGYDASLGIDRSLGALDVAFSPSDRSAGAGGPDEEGW